jgi:hypothetical protein
MQKLKNYNLVLMAVMVAIHTMAFVIMVTAVRAQKMSVNDLDSVGESRPISARRGVRGPVVVLC